MVSFLVFSECYAYRLKDEDVVVVNGIITNCVYDISTKGNVIEIPEILDNQTVTGIGDYAFSVAGKIAILTLPKTLKTIGNGVFEGHALSSLVIPDGVTSIGNRAFYGNALSNINLPAGLQSIADETFANNQLNSITLPDGLKYIGYSAFINNKITSLTIPNSVRRIQGSAFASNRISVLNFQAECQLNEISPYCFATNDIKTLSIPNSVLIINDGAFNNNINLNSVTLGANLLKIKRWAFANCNLKSVNFPGSLVFIGRYAFEGNYNLSSFKLPVSAKNYKWNDSNGDKHNGGDIVTVYNYSYVAIIPYTLTDGDVTVTNGIIENCSYFDEIKHIGSVITIPEKLNGQTITGIGGGVFNDRGISEITLPKRINVIGNYAFANNEIINLIIPASLNVIETEAFYNNCINTLTFEPTSELEFIGMDSFRSNRIVTINFPENVVKIEKFAFANNFIQSIKFEANSKLLSIGSSAFVGNGMLSFTLPDPKVNSYDYWVDWDNNQYSSNRVVSNFESFYKIPVEYTLTDADIVVVNGVIISTSMKNPNANIITIPDILDGQKIIGVGNGAFSSLGLIGVNLPSSLQTIYYGAFGNNDILKVIIPANIEKIEGAAFFRNNINVLVFEENSRLKQIDWGAFYINRITSLTLPDSLTTINDYAFGNNRISNGLVIPDSVKYIGWGAFGNNQIPQVFFSDNSTLSHLGSYAFADNLISNDINIPKTLTEISDFAFQNNNISKVITHEGIVDYGNGAFQFNNPSLKIILHKPPTIPFVTHFFGWKDSDGIYHYPGETITDFSKRYKAVIDQFFVVKFVVKDDNNTAVENASIQFYNELLSTDKNGIDSIGPVMRGSQNYNVAAAGCYAVNGNIDVQDNMTVQITLIRYYNLNIKIVDTNNIPITGAAISINGSGLISDNKGNVHLTVPDGDYPFIITTIGYRELSDSVKILDSDNSIIIKLYRVSVNYFPNNGTGTAYSDITFQSEYVTDNNIFTRNGYTFSNWNTQDDNTGTKFSENESVSLKYSDIDLFAIWKPVDYKVIYHLDGGTNNPGNPGNYNIESEINLLPASKPSLYFATWIDADSNRVSRIEKGNTGDLEFWAVYTTEPTYFIDYHNIENASHNNQPVYTQFDLPMVFTDANKTGYVFDGWFEDKFFVKEITHIPSGSKVNYDVYAKWGNAIEYAISYYLDGGNNNPANPSKYSIESKQITFESPSKTGAVFVSWFSDKELTTQITGIPGGSTGDTAIYAKWVLDIYDIQYVLNGGVNNPLNPSIYNIDSDKIIFEAPSKTGAKFVGWYADKDLTIKISEIPTGSFGDKTIYAKWELAVYNIQYVLNGGVNNIANPASYTFESSLIVFEPATKHGGRFISWYSDDKLTKKITGIPPESTGDTTIYARWELDTFKIQYVLNGGNNHPANPSEFTVESNTIVFEAPSKAGARFVGWFSNNNLTNNVSEIPQGSTGDKTVFAKWELDNYSIRYVLNGGVNHPANPLGYTIESGQIVFGPASKRGANFMGWYNDKELTNGITGIPPLSTGDTTIFAKWELDTFKIQYVLNGGNNHPRNPDEYTIESDSVLFENPDKDGFFFDGWYTTSNYTEKISSIPTGHSGDITVYAKWLEIFTVSFVITTDSINPAKDVDIVINDLQKLCSDDSGKADILISDGSLLNYSIQINGIIIESGQITVAGKDETVTVKIVDCYQRWYDVLFCDNGKGLWSSFAWYKDEVKISGEQFFHQPGGIDNGLYKLKLISVAGVEYTWENILRTDKKWKNLKEPDIIQMTVFANPVGRGENLFISLSENTDLQASIILIYNSSGALITKINNPIYMNSIEINERFSSGLYHVILTDDDMNRKSVKSFIVN